jgi:SNF2 family DNA or RNA helicase
MRRVVLHRSKARVLPELPPVQCQDIPLAVNGAAIDAALTPQEQVARLALASKARRMSDEDIIRALQAVPAHGALSAVRHALGAAKVEATVEWVTERLSCGTRKLILFGWHRDVLEALHEKLGDYTPVLVTGTTAAAARAVAIERFQTHPLVRVFVGQLLATGTAVTLTAASEVAIVEPSWVPAENAQAIGRAHRLGQRDNVLASFLYIPGTLDQTIMRVFRRKAADIDAFNWETPGDQSNREENNHVIREAHHPGQPAVSV